jgi:hypothetical protein
MGAVEAAAVTGGAFVFLKYPDIPAGVLADDKAARVEAIAQGLQRSEIVDIRRRFVTLQLRTSDELVEGDVTTTGFTVYLGGFDWVTFPTPQHLLQRFPEFLPLPQQVFQSDEEEEPLDLEF